MFSRFRDTCKPFCRLHVRGTRKSSNTPPLTDELGLPLSSPWSVHDLLSSYPSPKLPDATLTRLHELAALLPPKEDSPEFHELKQEMEDLVKLVEAVKGVQQPQEGEGLPPDGRVWPKGRGLALRDVIEPTEITSPSGQELLKHAQRSRNGYYLVDSSKPKR